MENKKLERVEKYAIELLKQYDEWEKQESDWNQKRFYAGAQIALKGILRKIDREKRK